MKKNIVLITIDTLRFDHVGFNGYENKGSPFLDQLAKQSLVLDNLFTQGVETPIAHASIFSGCNPRINGFHRIFQRKHFPNNCMSLPVWLKKHGYCTAGFISAYALDRNRGFGAGFDTYGDKLRENDFLYHFHYTHALIIFEALKRIPFTPFSNLNLGKRRFADETTDKALHWLEQQDKGSPFFLFCHYFDTHCEYYSPEGFRTSAIRTNKKTLREYETGLRELTSADLECIVQQYDLSISHVDGQIARLVNNIKKKDFERDTIVIITSDHGEGLGDHNYMLHGCSVFDETTHVPCIIHSVNHEIPALRVGSLLRSIDLFPTILSLVKVPAYQVDGIDFAGALHGETVPDDLVAFTETRHTDLEAGVLRAVRSKNFKYIVDDCEREELYDMVDDPREERNIINSHRKYADELVNKMEKQLKETIRK